MSLNVLPQYIPTDWLVLFLTLAWEIDKVGRALLKDKLQLLPREGVESVLQAFALIHISIHISIPPQRNGEM